MNVRMLAFAKLNLNLEVIKRRGDGYHEIRSIVQTIDLADRLALSSAPEVRVVCDTDIEGINLAERAAHAVLDRKNVRAGVRIDLEKHIPIGAGLGGGSSDAAAVLTALNRWIPPRLGDDVLCEIGASIGADVPLFLRGGCLELSGLGMPERSLASRPETFLVVVPAVHCATAEVYRAWTPSIAPGPSSGFGRNDLLAAALRVHPELSAVENAIRTSGGSYSGMSGSGSAFFVGFNSRGECVAARERIVRQLKDVRVYCCSATNAGCVEEGDDA